MEPLLAALQAALPSAKRRDSLLTVSLRGGGMRVVVVRSPWDPQIEHGLVFPWLLPLDPALTLDACHLRTRCFRSVDAIEAARALAEGKDVETNATVLAVEAARQIGDTWEAFLDPAPWMRPTSGDVLRPALNVPPAEADTLMALLKAAALNETGLRADARAALQPAIHTTDPRLRRCLLALREKLGDA